MEPNVNDIARFRGPKALTKPVLNVVPKIVLATARVNQSSFSYPVFSLIVDDTSGWSNLRFGQMFTVGTAPGLDDIMTGVIRGWNPTVLQIDAKDAGDAGYPIDIAAALQNDQYITIYKFRPPWGLLSSIRGGVFYKQWSLQYTDQLFNPPPVTKFGGWRQAFIDDNTGTALVEFDASGSFAWGNATIATRAWDLDGGTVVSGSLSSASVLAEFSPGFYEIKHATIDSKGKVHQGYRYLWVNTNTPDEEWSPFSYRHVVRITSDTQDWNGRKMSFEVDGDVTDELFPGQGVFFKEYPRFQVESGDWEELEEPDDYPLTYVGYRINAGYKTNKNLSSTSIETEGPGHYAGHVPSATQQIVETQYPTNWAQCSPILSDPVGATWYTTYWHAPYIINGHDFDFDPYLRQLRKRSFQFNSTQIGPQLSGIQEMMLGLIGWKSDGTLKMVRNPMYFTNAERNDMDTWWEFLPKDIMSQLEISSTFIVPTGQVYGTAFSFDGNESTPFASLAPGYSRSQGVNTSNPTAFIVPSSQGQLKVNQLTGHHYAMENRETPDFSFQTMKGIDVVEPINIDNWCILNVGAEYDPEGYGWVNKRLIPTKVTRNWSLDPEPYKQITTEWQVESFGLPGITVPIDRGGANNWWQNGWNPSTLDPYEPKSPDLGFEIDLVYAWNDDGKLGRTESFTREETAWERVTGFQGFMRDACLDMTSPFWTDPDDNLRGWFVTDSGPGDNSTIRVYYVQDLFALSIAFLLEETFTTGVGYNGKVRIASTNENDDLAVLAWKDRTGVKFSRITTSGHNWSAAATVGSIVSDPDHDDDELGLSVKGETQVIIAPDGSIDSGDGQYNYFLFQATTASGAFNAVPNAPSGERAVLGTAQLQDDSTCVLGYEGPGTSPPTDPLSIVTFDGSGYTHYDTLTFPVGAVGPFPPAVYQPVNQFGNGAVSSIILLEGEYLFQKLEFLIDTEGQFDGSDFGPYQYSIGVFFYKGYGTANETVVATRTFTDESPYYDQTKFKSVIEAAEMGYNGLIDAIQISAVVSKPQLTSGIWYFFMDNIDITAQFVQRDSTWLTRSVSLPTGIWSDISPSIPVAPKTPYGVGISGNKYNLIGFDENGFSSLFYSGLSGSSWSNKKKTKAIGSKRGDDVSVFFGYNLLTISEDDGTTQYSRIGDWPVKIGKVGTIRGMVGTF